MTIPTLSPVSEFNVSVKDDDKPFDLGDIKNDKDAQNSLIAWTNMQYTKIRQARFRIEQQWYLNLAFYLGKQNVITQLMNSPIIGQTGRLVTPPAPPWRPRPVINKVRRYVRKEHSKIMANKPTAYVVPATGDDADIFAAAAAEQIWDSIFQSKHIDRVMRNAAWWMLWCGSSFIKEFWNESQIDAVSDQQGDICFEAVTPFHLLVPDFVEQNIENQAFVMHISTKDVSWVKVHYPKTLSGKPIKPNVNASNSIIDAAFINLIAANNLQTNMVLIQEVWVKPGSHRLFPNGGVFTIAGNQIVQAFDGWPYDHKDYPFTKFDHVDNAKFYSDSSLVDLIPLQREYNRTHGQIIEAKNRMAKPQLLAQQGAVDPKKISTEPGQVILYKAGFQKPEPLEMQNLPPYVMEELQLIAADMDDIVGQHDISSGQVPPGMTAATAIAYLQEADDSIIHDTIASIEEGYEKLGRQLLSLCSQFWDTKRMVKVTGTDGSFDVLQLSSDDLQDNTDLRVISGSAFPISQAGKTATIMDLMKMGFVDANTGLELLEIGGVPKLYENIQVDTRQAQRENVRMQRADEFSIQTYIQQAMQNPEMDSEGNQLQPPGMVPVNTWDNHMTHINVHNRFRKSQSFEVLDDATKQLFEEHVQMHVMAMGGQMSPGPNGLPVDPNALQQGSQMPSPVDNGGQVPPSPMPPPEGAPNG